MQHSSLTPRIFFLDAVKTSAILMMIVFHFLFDLSAAGMINVLQNNLFIWFGKLIGILFFMLMGWNLHNAYSKKIRWKHWFKHWFKLFLCSLFISLITFYFFPKQWIYLGVLHGLAFCSVVTLLFLKHPTLSLLMACLILTLDLLFNFSLNIFIYLYRTFHLPAATLDFYPPLPWLSFALLGVWLSSKKLFQKSSLPDHWKKTHRTIKWFARHSLLIYMIHQPILYPISFFLASFFA